MFLRSYWKKTIPLEALLTVNDEAEELAWKLQADAGAPALHHLAPRDCLALRCACTVIFPLLRWAAAIASMPTLSRRRWSTHDVHSAFGIIGLPFDVQASTSWVWMGRCTTWCWTPSSTWALPLSALR